MVNDSPSQFNFFIRLDARNPKRASTGELRGTPGLLLNRVLATAKSKTGVK